MIKNRTAILVLLTALNLLNYVDRMIVAAVLKKIKAPVIEGGLDLSNSQAGLLATAFLLGYFITSPIFGARADKGARKGLIALGVAVWSIATVVTGFAQTFWLMILARVFVGVGEASYATLAPTIIDDLTPPEQKGRALAIFYLAIPVGSALGYVVGGFIEARWGWRSAFFICGGPGLVLALSCLLIVEPERKLREAKGKIIDGLRTLAKLPLFRRAVLGYCTYTAALGAFAYWAPTFIAERFPTELVRKTIDASGHEVIKQTALESANYYFGLATILSGIIGTLIGGRWADSTQRHHPVSVDTAFDDPVNKRGVNALLRICAIGMVWATPFAAAAFLMPTPWMFFAAAFLAEIGLFLSTSPVNAIGLRAVPPELRASAMAAMIFAIHLFGDLWSPTVLGFILDYVVATIAMMALPITFAWSAYLWWPRRSEAA
ncbi:MAG TPA: MFS transporter [Kofleriaceae bacterium]|nr:MFS transporter [Kofleriaceae bacterium]